MTRFSCMRMRHVLIVLCGTARICAWDISLLAMNMIETSPGRKLQSDGDAGMLDSCDEKVGCDESCDLSCDASCTGTGNVGCDLSCDSGCDVAVALVAYIHTLIAMCKSVCDVCVYVMCVRVHVCV